MLDCRSVHAHMGGVGCTALGLARTLPSQLLEHDVVLLWGSEGPHSSVATAAESITVDAAMVDPHFEQRELPRLLHGLGADLYHNPCFSVPIEATGVRKVATVHDVVFRRLPHLVDPEVRDYFDNATEVSCRVADALVTVSAFSKRELTSLYDVSEGAVHVIYNGIADQLRNNDRVNPGGQRYILYVGCIEEKKNVIALVRAFAALVRRTPSIRHDLVVVGGTASDPVDLATAADVPHVRDRIQQRGYVSDEEVARLYAAADVFCYLSAYEGFGLPPIEAMAAGVPTLVAERGALPEVTAGGALLVDPDDQDAIVVSLQRLLTDQALRDRLSSTGRAIARRYSWLSSAARLAQLYRATLARHPRVT